MNNLSTISWQEWVLFQWDVDDDDVCFVNKKHVELEFCSTSPLTLQSMDRHIAQFWHSIPILSQPVYVLIP